MRQFEAERSYDVAPERLVLLWRDLAFLRAVDARYGGVAEPEISEDAGRVVVRRQRELPVDRLPGFVRRLMSGSTIMQVDSWPVEPSGERIDGEWRVEGRGIPATMSGTQRVTATGAGCRCSVIGSIGVSAPLIGGSIEEIAVREVRTLIGKEQDLAAQWLAEHPGDVAG